MRAYVNLLNSVRYAYYCCTEGSSFLSDGAGRRSRINHHHAVRYRRVNNIQSVCPTDRANRLHAMSAGRSRRCERWSSNARIYREFSGSRLCSDNGLPFHYSSLGNRFGRVWSRKIDFVRRLNRRSVLSLKPCSALTAHGHVCGQRRLRFYKTRDPCTLIVGKESPEE